MINQLYKKRFKENGDDLDIIKKMIIKNDPQFTIEKE